MTKTLFNGNFKLYLKKSKGLFFSLLICLLLPAGCSKKNETLSPSEGSISDNIISEEGRGVAEESTFSGSVSDFSDETAVSDKASVKESDNKTGKKSGEKPVIKKINYDLTKMNYNMISSLLFDFIINPKKYAGKSVKIDGQFETSVHENKRYFAVIKWDVTGCCPAGLDFIPPEDLNFPEDFPEKGTAVTVTGILQYTEDEETDDTVPGELQFIAYDMQINE